MAHQGCLLSASFLQVCIIGISFPCKLTCQGTEEACHSIWHTATLACRSHNSASCVSWRLMYCCAGTCKRTYHSAVMGELWQCLLSLCCMKAAMHQFMLSHTL